jgi:broad specificity phosphatase PhoE
MASQEAATQLRILFIRHGERDHSNPVASNVLIPLTQRGHRQALVTGEFLSKHVHSHFGQRDAAHVHVYSSPFLRCLQVCDLSFFSV